jgi:flavin-dependent thymidylate synthase
MNQTRSNTVELLGFYGDDETIALSAWTSTSRELTPEKQARIPKLLKDLATNGHETPFEKSTLHFLVTTDIASHIHLIKHRIGVSVNAESARYRELLEDKFYVPGDWPEAEWNRLNEHCLRSFGMYHDALARLTPVLGRKRAKESCRYYLPYATQITSDVSYNLRSFIHFQLLRNDSHAQDEIHYIAAEMLRLTRETGKFNASLEAFGY